MPSTGADLFVSTLEQYGVNYLFGNPGTTELPIMNVLGESDRDLEYVLTLHEDVAVGMAAGYAKTRRWHAFDDPSINPVGVVNLHVAPGLAHGLGNMFDSGHIGSGAPIVVTAGAHSTDHQHREPNLHADLVRMANQFTKWSAEVKNVAALPTMLRRAVRVSLTPPTGPVFLALPFDVMTAETDAEPERLGSIPEPGGGNQQDLARAADAVVNADEVVMVVGDSLARAGPEAVTAAVDFAESAGVRVHGEFRSSEIAFPTDHDLWAGGLPDDKQEATALMDAETLILAGTISNVPTNPPDVPNGIRPGTTCIHISDSPWEIGKNYVADIGLVGNPGAIMQHFVDRVDGRIDPDTLTARMTAAREVSQRRDGSAPPTVTVDDPRASNAQLADGVATAAPNARVVAEATTSSGALRRRYDFDPGQFFNFRGGGLGYGLPASVGTALAEAEQDQPRDVIGFIGDGAYLYYPNTLYTAARYDIDLTVVVPDNRNYRILKNNMLALFGGDEADYDFVGMDFEPPVDIPANATSHGAPGRVVAEPDEIAPAVEEALAETGPTVLDVLVHD